MLRAQATKVSKDTDAEIRSQSSANAYDFGPSETEREQMYNNAWSEKLVDGIWLGTGLNTNANIVDTETRGVTQLGESTGDPSASAGVAAPSMLSRAALRNQCLDKAGRSRALKGQIFAEAKEGGTQSPTSVCLQEWRGQVWRDTCVSWISGRRHREGAAQAPQSRVPRTDEEAARGRKGAATG